MRLPDIMDPLCFCSSLFHILAGSVGRTVVDQDNLKVAERLGPKGFKAPGYRPGHVVDRYNDTDENGIHFVFWRKEYIRTATAYQVLPLSAAASNCLCAGESDGFFLLSG